MNDRIRRLSHVKLGSHAPVTAAQVTTGLRRLLPRGAYALARTVRRDDSDRLWPEEAVDLGPAVPHVLSESGAARVAARDLMTRLGYPQTALRRNARRSVDWPSGLVGSLTHTKTMAAAVLAPLQVLSGIGIDLELPYELEPELAAMILTDTEARAIDKAPISAHLFFSIKEAVYKAVHPVDGVFLDFKDVELDISTGTARTFYGRTARWSAASSPMLMSVAWISLGDPQLVP